MQYAYTLAYKLVFTLAYMFRVVRYLSLLHTLHTATLGGVNLGLHTTLQSGLSACFI